MQRADVEGLRVNRHSGAIVNVLARARGRAVNGMADAIARCEIAARSGAPCLVEHHRQTLGRVLSNPSHAHAFVDNITEWEPVADAIAALDVAIQYHGRKYAHKLESLSAVSQ